MAPDKIVSDTIWREQQGPFVILSDLVIEKDAKLSIENGAVIAVSGDTSILVYGDLAVGKIGEPNVTIDSTVNLADQFPEFEQWTFDGQLGIYVYGSDTILANIDVKIPLHLQSDSGNIEVSGGRLVESGMTFLNGARGRIIDSTMEASDDIMIQGTSTLMVKDSSIEGLGVGGSLFNVFKNSSISFENSIITPNLMDFALVLDGSSLTATSTRISGIGSYGIQASRGSMVSLYEVSMDTIFSPVSSSAFVMLVGSDGFINQSNFSNTASNAIELYKAGDKLSHLLLRHSKISNFGGAGISAVQANLSVTDSIIENGGIGIENIFATSTVSNSKISGNTKYGVAAYIANLPVHAENNFWGDPSGPYHHVSNTTGFGDTVSDNVIFSPWLVVDPKAECCSNVMFLPGIESSRLYQDETRLWEPSLRGTTTARLLLDENGRSLYGNIYAKEVIKEAFVPFGPNIYKSFFAMIDDLKQRKVITDWLAVPYDWRLSFDDIANSGIKTIFGISYLEATSSPFIMTELKRLAATSKTGKVTIVTHSNGGLLAKTLISKLFDAGLGYLVDQVILVAVPHIGSVEAIGALLHGYNQSIPFLFSAKETVALALNMPSAYNLLPSAKYFELIFDPVIKFRNSKTAITSANSFYDFLRQKKLNPLLLERSELIHETYDKWLPPSGVKIIQIAGWGVDTLSGIEYFQSVRRGKPIPQYKPIMVIDGDSTVVVPSALYLSTSTPNVERYWLDLTSHNRTSLLSRKHGNIFEVKSVNDFIEQIIEKKKQPLPAYISTSTPVTKKGAKRLHFTLYSAELDLHLYDETGGHTGVSTTTLSLEEKVTGTYYQKFGEVKYLSTYATVTPMRLIVSRDQSEIETAQFPSSFTLEIDEVIENDIATTSVFVDLPATENTVAILDVPESISDLNPIQVDENNDGVFDFKLGPKEVFSYQSDLLATTTVAVVEVLGKSEIISDKTGQSMETTNMKIYTQTSKSQPGRRGSMNVSIDTPKPEITLKTSLREIQELIDSIKLPNSISTSTIVGKKDVEVRERASSSQMNNQLATVFQNNHQKNALYSFFLIIIAILKAILRWFINLFNL